MTVEVSDIATSLGRPLSTSEQAQAEQWIADAYLLIQAKFGATYPDLDPNLVDYVVRESVTARFRDGSGGATSITVAVDDGNVTRRWDNDSSRHDSWLLPGWIELLSPDRDSVAFSTRPTFEPDRVHWTPPPPRCDPDWWTLP